MSSIPGEFVTETFDYDGGRQVTAYVPLRPPEAVVFAGDGQLISRWGPDLEAAKGPSTMSANGCGRASTSPRLPTTPRRSGSRPEASSHWPGTPAPGHLRCPLPRVTRRRVPTACPDAEPAAAGLLAAGTHEPFFLENATRWADALRDAGADVVITERVGSHGDPFWREELPRMVAWAFGR